MRSIFNHRADRGCLTVVVLALGMLALGSIGGCATGQGPAGPSAEKSNTQPGKSERRPAAPIADNAELAALYAADQADRTPGTAPSDWHIVETYDAARQARVRQMLDADLVKTGQDYFHAGMVYQHATDAEGVQLAHELAMIGACLGSTDARWLAAASYDRFLMDLKRPQRFGTQYRSSETGAMKLYETSEGVTDAMRAALNTPSLQKAKDREKEMQEMLDELAKTMKAAEPSK